jgi:Icc protein
MDEIKKTLRLIQISDTHLEKEEGGRLLGMDTDQSLGYVLDLVKQENPLIDLVLVTGDVSTHGTPEAYERFKNYMDLFDAPVICLPGNHDDNTIMADHCGDMMVGHYVLANWLVVCIDSTIHRQVGGLVEQSEIERLRSLAATHPDKNILVTFHHPPVSIDCAWLDPQRIKNGDDFLNNVTSIPSVKLMLCGHIHQEWSAEYNGVPIMSTPSTCIQFKPKCYDFTIDTLAPGYRRVDLSADGSYTSQISRVVGADLTIDFESSGY